MKFVIPLPPNRANDRSHWRKVHRDKTAYWVGLDTIQLVGTFGAYTVPQPPDSPFQKASASATMFLHQHMDAFNCGNRLKWVEDWLVKRGYIEDDRMAVLQWAGVPNQVIDRKNPRVELSLEEIE